MEKLFSYDGKVSDFIRKASDLLMINTYWLICCIPLITIGASTTAMYYTLQKSVKNERGIVTQEFFRSFISNFRLGTKIWLFYLCIGAVIGECIYYFYQRMLEGKSWGMIYWLYVLAGIGLVFMVVYTFGYLARFESNFKKTVHDAFIIMLANGGTNVKIAVVLIIMVVLIKIQWMFILFVPVTMFVVISKWTEKIFKRYMSEADLELEQNRNAIEKD